MIGLALSLLLAQTVVDFEAPAVLLANDKANRVEQWKEKGVVFRLAHPPTKNKGKGLVMFFEHLASGRKGLGSAMALEAIPVRATFPQPASSVSVSFWGSTGIPVILEAFDAQGNRVDRAEIKAIPLRQAPNEPEPIVTLSVKAPSIAYIEYSGARPGEFLAADELRFTPASR